MLRTFFYVVSIIVALLGGIVLSSLGIVSLGGNVGTTVNVTSVLNSVQSLSQLTTTRYTYTVNLNVARDLPPLLAIAYGQQLTLQATGHVNAGVDLSLMNESNIRVDGNTLVVQLPSASLQDCFFNENASRVVDQRSALFASFPEDLQVEARRIAIRHFRERALTDGVLDEANTQAVESVAAFLSLAAGEQFESIRILPAPGNLTPDIATLPVSCGGQGARPVTVTPTPDSAGGEG